VRLFVAVWPPDDILDLVAGITRPEYEALRWTTREQWHVTLLFLGEVPDPDPVAEALRTISDASPVSARLGPRSAWFPGGRVLQIPVDGLAPLESRVNSALSGLEHGRHRRPLEYRGHMTLGRIRGNRGLAREDRSSVAGAEIASTWMVESVSLVASVLGGGGSRYTDVVRVVLGGD
jgi:2'-5' RNA ligase